MSKISEEQAAQSSQMLKEVHDFAERMCETYVTDTKRRAIMIVAIDQEAEIGSVPSTVCIAGDMNTLGPGLAGILSENDKLKSIISKAMMTSVLFQMAIKN